MQGRVTTRLIRLLAELREEGRNRDPAYAANLLLHKLTVEALKCVEQAGLSRRELARRLNTSLSPLYRLLDPTNYKKSAAQMIQLLHVLGVDVDIVTTLRDAA